MSEFDHDRVLAIMAKAPRAGHVKTRLASVCNPAQIVQLYRTLIEDTVTLARGIGVSIAAVCPSGDAEEMARWLPSDVRIVPQAGTGLADGLTSTFARLCDTAPRGVIAFNSDSPHLPPEILESAFAALADHDLVIGPCDDGGYYMVGARRAHAGLFEPQSMGTSSALEALVLQTRQLHLSTAISPSHYDVDMPDDLVRLARQLATQPERAPRTAELLAEWQIANLRAQF